MREGSSAVAVYRKYRNEGGGGEVGLGSRGCVDRVARAGVVGLGGGLDAVSLVWREKVMKALGFKGYGGCDGDDDGSEGNDSDT